jgi:3-hydroxybutyryl-CoA dehydrogenase
LECVIEMPEVKKAVYNKIESVVGDDAIIASNTSAIPITELQQYIKRPARFLGIHWAEPSYMTRFMEITCGEKTTTKYADWVFELAHHWGKEPTLLRKDLRGFVTNRLMYAIYREGLHLVDTGQATLEDVDKIFRYDAGSWITLMGIFRRMDFMGLKDYPEILKNTFPKLSNEEKVPGMMQEMIAEKVRGTQSVKGLYSYTAEEARKWDESFAQFNEEIFRLAALYPSSVINNQTK